MLSLNQLTSITFMKTTINTVLLTGIMSIFTGCASNPNDLPKAEVSSNKFSDYNCEMIENEFDRNDRRTQDLYRHLKKERDDDVAAAWIGGVLFWPALFALEFGDDASAEEFSQLRGEWDALERATLEKKCDASIVPEDPVDVIKREIEMEVEQAKKEREEAESNNPYKK